MLYGDLFFIIIELAGTAALYLLAGYASKVLSTKWRLCYVLPMVICIVFGAVTGFEISLAGVYAGAVIMLAGFLREDKKVRRAASVMAGVLIAISLVVCLINPGYRTVDFTEDFDKGFDAMKDHYCLAEYKEINWDALYDKYYPQFEKADKKHDEVENYILWQQFCGEFHDGHVAYSADADIVESAYERMYGNDYGLSVMTLSDGQTVAVNVEPDSVLTDAGIHNGTVITAWDGRTIETAEADIDMPLSFCPYNAVQENDDFYRALLVAGMGGESVTISFLDNAGEEKSVTVPKCGVYADRLQDTVHTICRGVEGSNLTWSSLNQDTACLRISGMMYDSKSFENGDHSQMKTEIKEKLLELEEADVQNLVIDLRDNTGGSPEFILAIAELLAPEGEHTYIYDGVWDETKKVYQTDPATGKYVTGAEITYSGENMWADGEIVILVNSGTISAGDHFTKLMSDFDNVTVMGFNTTNGSGQGIRGVSLEGGMLQFSSVPVLDADGDIFIDTDASGISQVSIDVKVPFDEEAVHILFDEGGDYVLSCALGYLGEN
ncbi:MAG: S41 family peptidase [Wujia sp.]